MRPLILALAFAFAAVPVAAQPPAPADLLFQRFERYVEALRTQAGIPGLAAAVVGENGIVWERAMGLQNLEGFVQTSPDTPFQMDGLTQLFTATLVLQCAEQGRISLNAPISQFDTTTEDGNATIAQILTHTSGSPLAPLFAYRPERIEWLKPVVRACTGDSFRETLANQLELLAMKSSVPGADVVHLVAPAEGVPDATLVQQYTDVLARLTTSYVVRKPGQATAVQHSATTLTATSGLISTVRDFAQFDVALRKGLLISADTLALAWSAPPVADAQTPRHGLGWFIQTYKGETIVWQFGASEASSSLVVTVPGRGLTLVMLANSDGLVTPFGVAAGDVTTSPFALAFLAVAIP
jgi:CubicO group peptidase (beta-lactamase class C family)